MYGRTSTLHVSIKAPTPKGRQAMSRMKGFSTPWSLPSNGRRLECGRSHAVRPTGAVPPAQTAGISRVGIPSRRRHHVVTEYPNCEYIDCMKLDIQMPDTTKLITNTAMVAQIGHKPLLGATLLTMTERPIT